MEPLGRFLRVLNGLNMEHIEGPPRGFLRGSLQYTPKGVYWVLKGPSKGLHSPRYTQGFYTDCHSFWIPNKQTYNIKNTANVAHVALGSPLVLTLGPPLESLSTYGVPRVYHGEYTWQQTVPLTQLNLNMQARDLERMLYIWMTPNEMVIW